ncbi:hypothetical protein C0J52_00055 [Blattella germanica]|nr:hypothetical protein C0J52_00055 [Blattella germanica]
MESELLGGQQREQVKMQNLFQSIGQERSHSGNCVRESRSAPVLHPHYRDVCRKSIARQYYDATVFLWYVQEKKDKSKKHEGAKYHKPPLAVHVALFLGNVMGRVRTGGDISTANALRNHCHRSVHLLALFRQLSLQASLVSLERVHSVQQWPHL